VYWLASVGLSYGAAATLFLGGSFSVRVAVEVSGQVHRFDRLGRHVRLFGLVLSVLLLEPVDLSGQWYMFERLGRHSRSAALAEEIETAKIAASANTIGDFIVISIRLTCGNFAPLGPSMNVLAGLDTYWTSA
jgi:hypothetical protein